MLFAGDTVEIHKKVNPARRGENRRIADTQLQEIVPPADPGLMFIDSEEKISCLPTHAAQEVSYCLNSLSCCAADFYCHIYAHNAVSSFFAEIGNNVPDTLPSGV
jgi:hypothetical protein